MTVANKTVTDFTIANAGEGYATPAAIVTIGGYHSATVIAHMQVHERCFANRYRWCNYRVGRYCHLGNGTGTKPTFKVTGVNNGTGDLISHSNGGGYDRFCQMGRRR